MIDYKKIKKYRATGKQARTSDSIPISNLTEKTDTINNFEFLALDDTNLNQSLKLNLAEHSKQIGEANKVIDSDDIIVSEEIDNDLGKTQKLSVVNKVTQDILTITTASDIIEFTIEQLTSYKKIIVDITSFLFVSQFTIQFPQGYNSSNNLIDIEILYNKVIESDILLLQVKFFDVTTNRNLGNFVMIPKNNTIFPEITRIPDYKISFSFSNRSIRKPRGIVMAQAISGGSVYGGEILDGGYGANSVVHSYNMVFFTNGNPPGDPRFYPTLGGYQGTAEHSMKLGSIIIFFNFQGNTSSLANPVVYGSSSLKAHIVFEGNNSGYFCHGLNTRSAFVTGSNKTEYYRNYQYWTGGAGDNSITCTSFANPYLILATGEGF